MVRYQVCEATTWIIIESSLAIVLWSLKGWNNDLGTSSTVVRVDIDYYELIDYATDLEAILVMVKYDPDDKPAGQLELYHKMDILLLCSNL